MSDLKHVIWVLVVLLALGSSGGALGDPGSASLPQDLWRFQLLEVCFTGPKTGQACARLNSGLFLKVEERTRGGTTSKVTFEEKLTKDSAQHLFASALAVIRSFGAAAPGITLDGNGLSVALIFNGQTAKIQIDGISNAAEAGPELEELIHSLRSAAPAVPWRQYVAF